MGGIAGPNYRGFDLCKLFRNDAGPVAGQQLRNFLRLYLEHALAWWVGGWVCLTPPPPAS